MSVFLRKLAGAFVALAFFVSSVAPADASPGAARIVLLGQKQSTNSGNFGDLIAISARDSTPINSVNGNGWTVDLRFKGMAPGGTLSYSGKTLALQVQRPGFDTSCNPTTYTDQVEGRIALRQPAPNQTTFAQTVVGSDVAVTTTVNRRIYASDTILSATASAGLYTASAVPSNAFSGSTGITNLSSWAYPDVAIAWAQPQLMRATGSTFRVELAVAHLEARLGQQVACVEFRVRDISTGTDQGISVKVGSPSISTYLTGGNDVEVFAGDIPLTSLTQGTSYDVYALAYPWVGTAPYDTRNLPTPLTTANATSLRFLNDKNGTYGDKWACVRVAGAGGAPAVQTGAFTSCTTTIAYGTVNAAAVALAAANNAKAGGDQHNNSGGSTIYLMEDSAGVGATVAGFGTSLATPTSGAATWTVLRKDPAASGTIQFVTGSQKNPGTALKLQGLTLNKATVAGNTNDFAIINCGSANNKVPVWLDGVSYAPAGADQNGSLPPVHQCGLTFVTNSTFTEVGLPFSNFSNTSAMYPLIGGNTVLSTNKQTLNPRFVLGNVMQNMAWADPSAATTNIENNDTVFMGWNSFYSVRQQSNTVTSRTKTWVALVSNLHEILFDATGPSFNIGGDSGQVDVPNYIIWHTTTVGNRSNVLYTSSGVTTDNLTKWGGGGYHIESVTNTKSDVFYVVNDGQPSGALRTGNWAWRYGVGRRGMVNLLGGSDNGGAPTLNAGAWLGEVAMDGAAYSVGLSAVPFVNAQQDGAGGAGNGDYHLVGPTNAAFDRVPAGWSVLKYDLDGNLRRTDGTGAAGVYERP